MPYRRRRSRRSHSYDRYPPYVAVAERRAQAQAVAAGLAAEGQVLRPVYIQGRNIARTFWGKAWCANLEAYSDYSNRLPRGRSYARNGSVIDLSVEPAYVRALVAGSSLYRVEIGMDGVDPAGWLDLVDRCADQIASVVDLLRGELSPDVMRVVSTRDRGLFPNPKELEFACTCPDWASMCKHVAAVLYGVGARLDDDPSLLFTLRQADPAELVRAAGQATFAAPADAIDEGDLGDIFGIDLDPSEMPSVMPSDVSSPMPPDMPSRLPAPAPSPAAEITASILTGRGIPHSRIQSWLRSGVLGRSGRRGVYLATARTGPAIATYLAGR